MLVIPIFSLLMLMLLRINGLVQSRENLNTGWSIYFPIFAMGLYCNFSRLNQSIKNMFNMYPKKTYDMIGICEKTKSWI